jgi:hypothetical protein
LQNASLYQQVSWVDDGGGIRERNAQMWLQHVGEERVSQIGTFPALFVTYDTLRVSHNLTFRRNSFLLDSCPQLLNAVFAKVVNTNSRKSTGLAMVKKSV